MRLIGLLGGMSPESTTVYYSVLNRLVQERLGRVASLKTKSGRRKMRPPDFFSRGSPANAVGHSIFRQLTANEVVPPQMKLLGRKQSRAAVKRGEPTSFPVARRQTRWPILFSGG